MRQTQTIKNLLDVIDKAKKNKNKVILYYVNMRDRELTDIEYAKMRYLRSGHDNHIDQFSFLPSKRGANWKYDPKDTSNHLIHDYWSMGIYRYKRIDDWGVGFVFTEQELEELRQQLKNGTQK